MKKLISIILILCLFPVVSLADDLSSMSYEDLITLSRQITAEIMSRPEWKEVDVPSGEWVIGEDIPEGYYSITATDRTAIVSATPIGSKAEDFYHVIGEGETVGKAFFKTGSIFKTSRTVILAPPKGLGF